MKISSVFTPANLITILRLVLVPVFAIFVIERNYGWALVVLIGAGLTDAFDGLVARWFKQETALGVALDPIADKLFAATAYLTLTFRHALPWWLTLLVLGRDVAISGTALVVILLAGYRPFHPSLLGKFSTFFQLTTLFAAVALESHLPLVGPGVLRVSIYLTVLFTVVSGLHYLAVFARHRAGPSIERGGAERVATKN